MTRPRWSWTWYALLAVGTAALVIGWREFRFLTDDAYITFRYASNSARGWGYVWNPPPFRPVEGYSNFLWLVLLDWSWRLLGVPPPRSANWISLGFSFGTLALTLALVKRLVLPPALERSRFVLAALVLVATLSNRTFLAWTSSGLETALFGFAVVLWVFAVLRAEDDPRRGTLLIAAGAAAAAGLTRPDGLLLGVGTGALVVALWRQRRLGLAAALVATLPLLLLPAHFAWRRTYYGEWLPNTFFAKQGSPWPEAGLRYAWSFLLEYGLWVGLGLASAAGVAVAWRRGAAGTIRALAARPGLLVVVAVLAAHLSYFTFLVGGDHFEYRVYAHLVPVAAVAAVACLARLHVGALAAAAGMAATIAMSLPLPWIHYVRTRDLTDRARTHQLLVPVADALPGVLRWYGRWFDAQQSWLIGHYIGLRHQDHKTCHDFLVRRLPTREQGERLGGADRPVLVVDSVGVAGWVLPEVAILDVHGLNDRVVARTPATSTAGSSRRMAHEHVPPPGYFECFDPNVVLLPDGVALRPRAAPLTDERIRRCESGANWAAP